MSLSERSLQEVLSWRGCKVASSLAYGEIELRIGSAGEGGPVGVLTASVHGDEGPWGTLAINRLLSATPASDLLGTLRVVPVAHPLATEANARQTHLDLLDLNNAFPGDPAGTHTQRLAAVIAEEVLEGADVVLDVHGGGSWNVNCFAYRFPGSHDVAAALGLPLVLDGPDRSTSLTGYARSRGAQGVWIETGGLGQAEEERIDMVTRGLRHALGQAGVLTETESPGSSVIGGEKRPLNTSSPGIYLPVLREVDLGRVVAEGTVIGQLLHPVTSEVLETFRAPFPQTMLALLRPTIARIEAPGQVVAMVAQVETEAVRKS